MLAAWRFLVGQTLLRLGDWLVTLPVVRWMWAGPSSEEIAEALVEFRPTDHESLLEMMAGRYLLASRLIDTRGVSPFAVEGEAEWDEALRNFAWLRHFRAARDSNERRFARTLVLDWIGREGHFDYRSWSPAQLSHRVLNWLRHFNLLVEDATADERRIVERALNAQIQALKVRGRLAAEPLDRLLAAIALTGVALCDERRHTDLIACLRRLEALLEAQIDSDGLHRSRSGKVQLTLLVELETVRQGLQRDHDDLSADFGVVVEGMHRALDAVSLSTGEPAYFNGTGQLPHDVVVAVQVQSTARFRSSGTAGGYGRLMDGRAVVVADSGRVPPPAFAGDAHASALAFEFSHGPELIVGNCGPAPVELYDEGLVFRQGIAHSGLTINGVSAARVKTAGPFAGRVLARGAPGTVAVGAEEQAMLLTTHGYERRYGVTLERRLTLMAEGKSLVGQDHLIVRGRPRQGAMAVARFHLALGTALEPGDDDDVLRLRLASGAVWSFLWEGADMRIEDSVRQSSYFGFHRIRQIVLETPLDGDREIAWIFTLDEHRRGKAYNRS